MGDPKEPRPQGVRGAELVATSEGDRERFLHDVFAVAWAPRHPRTEAVQIGPQSGTRDLEAHGASRRRGEPEKGYGNDSTATAYPRASLRRLPRMLIYNDWAASPNCLKTKILLLELGIPYERRIVDRTVLEGEAYRAKFPSAMAPSIEDDGFLLAESQAIALYLAEKHARLIPAEPVARALMYQALSFESALVAPSLGGAGYFGELYKPEAARSEARLAALKKRAQYVAATLAGVLGDRSYFAGEYSVADIQLYAATAKAIEQSVFETPARHLVDWLNRMSERAAVRAAREDYLGYERGA